MASERLSARAFSPRFPLINEYVLDKDLSDARWQGHEKRMSQRRGLADPVQYINMEGETVMYWSEEYIPALFRDSIDATTSGG
jgi:hypothetical protein